MDCHHYPSEFDQLHPEPSLSQLERFNPKPHEHVWLGSNFALTPGFGRSALGRGTSFDDGHGLVSDSRHFLERQVHPKMKTRVRFPPPLDLDGGRLLGSRSRLIIWRIIAYTAVASLLIWLTLPGHSLLLLLVLFILEFLLPWYFILHLGRVQSATESCVALAAAIYLTWGAFLLFHPVRFWLEPEARYIRWNWGAVAIFYVLILVSSLISWMMHSRSFEFRRKDAGDDARPWNPASIAGWLRLGFECLIVASIFFFWSTWFAVVGLAAIAILAIVRVPRLHAIEFPSRPASRIVRAVPGVLIGLTIGLVWTWAGWMPAAFVATLLVGTLVALRSPDVLIGRRARIAVLAALWTFAVSTQFVEPLRPRFPGSGYKPRKITALLPPPSQQPGKRCVESSMESRPLLLR